MGNDASLGAFPSIFGGPGSLMKILKKVCHSMSQLFQSQTIYSPISHSFIHLSSPPNDAAINDFCIVGCALPTGRQYAI